MMFIHQWRCIKNFATLLSLILSFSLITNLLLLLMLICHHQRRRRRRKLLHRHHYHHHHRKMLLNRHHWNYIREFLISNLKDFIFIIINYQESGSTRSEQYFSLWTAHSCCVGF